MEGDVELYSVNSTLHSRVDYELLTSKDNRQNVTGGTDWLQVNRVTFGARCGYVYKGLAYNRT